MTIAENDDQGSDDREILVDRFIPPTVGMLRNAASLDVYRDTEIGLQLERERVERVRKMLEERRRKVSGILSKPSPES